MWRSKDDATSHIKIMKRSSVLVQRNLVIQDPEQCAIHMQYFLSCQNPRERHLEHAYLTASQFVFGQHVSPNILSVSHHEAPRKHEENRCESTLCGVCSLAMHDLRMCEKGTEQNPWKTNTVSSFDVGSELFSRRGGRSSTPGLYNRSFRIAISFFGCISCNENMQARDASAEASWDSSNFLKRLGNPHFRACLHTKPVARKLIGVSSPVRS